MAEYHHSPIYAKETKDIPDWVKASENWQNTVPLENLQKHQLEVKMCCAKCEEIVVEEICEVYGVFDVRAEHFNSKVVVVSMPRPNNLNKREVLRRARKVDKKAKFVELDAKERPKTEEHKKNAAEEAKKKIEAEEKRKKEEEEMRRKKEEEEMRKMKEEEEMKKKEEEGKKKKGEEEERRKKEEEAMAGFMWTPHWNEPYYAPQSYPMRPSQWYEPGSFQEAEEAKKEEAEEKKRKEEEEMRKKKEEEDMRKEEQGSILSSGFMWRPHWDGPHYAPQSYPMRTSQWYEAGSSQAPPPFQRQCDEFSRLVS